MENNPGLSLPIVGGGLDQPLGQSFDYRGFLKQIDTVLDQALVAKDQEMFIDALHGLVAINQTSMIGLAYAFHRTAECWGSAFGFEGDFGDEIFQRTGYSAKKINKFIAVWEMVEECQRQGFAEMDIDLLISRPMIDLILLVNHQQRHGDLLLEQFGDVLRLADTKSLRDYLRGLRGDEEAPGRKQLSIVLKRDGTLVVMKDNKMGIIGFLNCKPEIWANPLLAAGLRRVIARAKIEQKGINIK